MVTGGVVSGLGEWLSFCTHPSTHTLLHLFHRRNTHFQRPILPFPPLSVLSVTAVCVLFAPLFLCVPRTVRLCTPLYTSPRPWPHCPRLHVLWLCSLCRCRRPVHRCLNARSAGKWRPPHAAVHCQAKASPSQALACC